MRRFRALIVVLVAMWLVEALNLVVGHRLNAFGLLPRSGPGLVGIVTAPFLHAGLSHLASNTASIAVLGGLVSLYGERSFINVTAFVTLTGGTAIWFFARSAFHVGASILVFGYFGYLLARGWHERSATSIVVALAVVALYGGLLWGVLPSRGVSFEGHLFGLLAGVGAAFLRLGRTDSVVS